MHWFRDMVDHWQALLAGILGLLAGVIAFAGALVAACWQVRASRSAAAAQVAAVHRQIEDAQAARGEIDERRRIVVEMAVKAEADRLNTEIVRVDPLWKKMIEEIEQSRLRIGSSPLLLGEREDAALLGDIVKTLAKIASILNLYNHHVEIWPRLTAEDVKVCRGFLDQLYTLTLELKK